MASPTSKAERACAGRPKTTQRKSSFSDAFDKFTKTKPFNRRRTTTLTASTSSFNFASLPASRLPTPAGIPKSTSFFGTLGPKPSHFSNINHENQPPVPSKRPRKISERLAQSSFFTYQDHWQQRQHLSQEQPSYRRNSKVRVEHRGLMQPIHPPLPKSQTMGNLEPSLASPKTPTVTNRASSNIKRSDSLNVGVRQPGTLSPSLPFAMGSVGYPSVIPGPVVQGQQNSSAPYPARKDSLSLPPTRKYNERHQREIDSLSESHAAGGTANEGETRSQAGAPTEHAGRQSQISLVSPFDTTTTGKPDNVVEDAVSTFDHPLTNTVKVDPSDPFWVTSSQPPQWWLGRYSALSDRFLDELLPNPPSSPSLDPKHEGSDFVAKDNPKPSTSAVAHTYHPMRNPHDRNQRVIRHLRGFCVNEEARESLEVFIKMMSERDERGVRGTAGGVEGGKTKKKWLEGVMKWKKT